MQFTKRLRPSLTLVLTLPLALGSYPDVQSNYKDDVVPALLAGQPRPTQPPPSTPRSQPSTPTQPPPSTPPRRQRRSTPISFTLPNKGTPGTRSGARRPYSLCNREEKLLTALVPIRNIGLTISERPTFWFYIPYHTNPKSLLEFGLVDDKEKKLVYKNNFQLTGTPGIISISLPQNLPPLDIDKNYHWVLSFYCDPASQYEVDAVDGYVMRVTLPSLVSQLKAEKDPRTRVILYAKHGIWYEILTDLAELRRQNPQDTQLANDWENLLRQSPEVQLEEIATKPIVSCCKSK